MTEKTLTLEEESQILELYEKITVSIPGVESEIKAISYEGFKIAVEHMMEIAELKGKLEALEVSLKTIRSVSTTAL